MHLRPRRASRPLLSLALLPLVRAVGIWSGGPCLSACQLWLSLVNFAGTPVETPFLEKQCEGGLRAASLYLCAELHCPDEDAVGGLQGLNESCQEVNATLPPLDIVAEYTEEDWGRVKRADAVDPDGVDYYDEPILPSEALFGLARDTLYAVAYVQKYHHFYGNVMSWFWAAVVFVGALRHMLHTRRPTQALSKPGNDPNEDSENESLSFKEKPGPLDRTSLYLRRFVTVPATFGHRCLQNIGWCTIPPRIETLAILLFLALNIWSCVHGYYVFTGNLYFPPKSKQIWRYFSDRTGILSWASFPAIWLFGMRNNILMGLTGWDFGTFNNFHRWVGRIATLQAVIHSVGYTVIIYRKGGWPYFWSWWELLFWWTGEVATISMCALVAASLFWLRRNIYEAFLVLHIVLSVVILVTMLFHVSIMLGEYDLPFWVCTFIWLSDRVLRAARILAFNPWFWSTRAKLSYSPASNTVRVVVPSSNSAYKPRPGTYYYIHVLSDSRPWESHPFTMAYASAGHDPADTETAPLLRISMPPASAGDSNPPSMTFLIRPYDSFTSRLKALAEKKASPRVLVEGPYGTTHRLNTFDDILFVVGGSGIVVPLTYLSQLNASPHVRSVRIVWSMREAGFASEVLRRDMSDAFEGGKVSMELYLTRCCEHERHLGAAEWPKEVRMVRGRPDITADIQCSARNALGSSVAVVACGPAKMADEARRAVVGVLGEGYHRVEYFQEAFNW